MSEDLGNPIASGRTSEIYPWGQEHILKLFHSWIRLESIENELLIARTIYESGLPVPEVGEILRVNGRVGLIYRRVYGESFYKAAQRRPWNIPHYFRRSAEIQVEIHSHSISGDFPSQRQILERDIQQALGIPENLRSKVLAALQDLPDSNQLCHGDFWAGNILITTQGEMIIDWNRASRGNPIADVARSTNAVLAFLETNQVRRGFLSYGNSKISQAKNALLRIVIKATYPIYHRRYFQLRPGGEAEHQRWLPIIAAARLIDEIPEMYGMLITQVEKYFL